MRFHIPIKLPSLANVHIHWRKLATIKKKQRLITQLSMWGAGTYLIPPLPLLVTITRVGPRNLDDDNLQGACKYVRDQIAMMIAGGRLGQRDGSNLFTWRYEQRKGKYGVDIEITSR